jgi:hypothetical protein
MAWCHVGPKGQLSVHNYLITHTTHDMSRKHNCFANYKRFSVVNFIQTIKKKLDSFQEAIKCSNQRETL